MFRSSSLRRRIVGAYLLLAITLSLCFCTIAFITVQAIEDQLINQRLEVAADKLIDDHIHGKEHSLPGYPTVLHGTELTPLMKQLPPGVHEIDMDDKALHILVQIRGDTRYMVVDDESQYERIERYMFVTLGGAFIMCVALAVVLGLGTASRVIAPVIGLAEAVQSQVLSTESPQVYAEDEIGVLARAFAQRSSEMQRFLQREQLFTGDVSHELRTPLTVMLGAAELLQVRLGDQPELQKVAERIRRTAAETAERVSALLLLSRAPQSIDAPALDLVPLVRQEIERCRPLLQSKPVALHLSAESSSVWISARPELVAIAIGNLVRNACQFTDQGQVSVSITSHEVVVADTGCGIPPEIGDRVFERFMRADASTEGTGLGLAIVCRVADHLGWKVTLHSDEGGGSRFTLQFA